MNWRDEYAELLQSLSPGIDKLCELQAPHVPAALYKYRTFDNAGYWKEWLGGTIVASAPTRFNDPFDCVLTMDKEINEHFIRNNMPKIAETLGIHFTPAEILALQSAVDPSMTFADILLRYGYSVAPQKLADLGRNDRYIDGLRSRLRVACFSEVNTEILMWSHYASDHTGFCIQYDITADEDMISMTYPVAYTNRRPILTLKKWETQTWPVSITLTKAEQWSYEKEWRYLNMSILAGIPYAAEADPFTYSCSGIPVPAVYLGTKCDIASDNVKELLKIAEANGTKVYQMKLSPTEFAVYPEQL